MKTVNGKLVSIRDEILPVIGKPGEGPDSLFVGESLLLEETNAERFLVPPMMSRVDKPLVISN
jgi:hypothetical protein